MAGGGVVVMVRILQVPFLVEKEKSGHPFFEKAEGFAVLTGEGVEPGPVKRRQCLTCHSLEPDTGSDWRKTRCECCGRSLHHTPVVVWKNNGRYPVSFESVQDLQLIEEDSDDTSWQRMRSAATSE
jgi:hypothetical protein